MIKATLIAQRMAEFARNDRYRGAFAAFTRLSGPFDPATAGPIRLRRGSWHARATPPARSSVAGGEIFDEPGNVGIRDRRAINLDHLGQFELPGILLEC